MLFFILSKRLSTSTYVCLCFGVSPYVSIMFQFIDRKYRFTIFRLSKNSLIVGIGLSAAPAPKAEKVAGKGNGFLGLSILSASIPLRLPVIVLADFIAKILTAAESTWKEREFFEKKGENKCHDVPTYIDVEKLMGDRLVPTGN